jgi:thiosulfate dehydrogenase [quinone] large subunit
LTKQRTYFLTAVAVALYLLLCWAFADGLFTGTFWDSKAIAASSVWTYVAIVLIVAAGLVQAQRLPEAGVPFTLAPQRGAPGQVEDPAVWRLLLGNAYLSIIWLPLRFFVGREWLDAGEHKLRSDAWMDGGSALKGFWESSVAINDQGTGKITYGWFRDLLQYMLDHEWYTWFAKVIAIGEFLIGLGLIVGALVGIAAFFGTLLNFNFQLAGSASSNPVLFGITVFLVLAWKVAGFWGLDRYLLPLLGTPWSREEHETTPPVASPARR